MFNKGFRPAINAGISVSRVGSAAQTKAMKKVSGRIKLELAQFRELEAFMQFAQDLDPETTKQIDAGQRLIAVLKQKNGNPMPFEREAVIMFAAVNGYLAKVAVEKVPEFEQKFLSYVDAHCPPIFESIKHAKDIALQTQEEIKTQLAKFQEAHPSLFEANPKS